MDISINTLTLLLAVATLVPAIICDVRARRIPNRLCLAGLVAAIFIHGIYGGPDAALSALAGALLAGALTFPLFARGWFGAGDVKLIAAMGAVAGTPATSMQMLVAIALAGGLLAVCRLYWQRRTQPGATAALSLSDSAHALKAQPLSTTRLNALPYAVAIAIGSLTVLMAQALQHS
ncbi:MAG: hypothetical protein RLZZ227_659 [Pseudomonadota bacterium]|jgi:prepilin peptidase CpaA